MPVSAAAILHAASTNTYFINQPLLGGTNFTSTLTWFADRNPGNLNNFSNASEQHLANLDLRVVQFDDPTSRNIVATIAESISLYNVVEHLSFLTPASGFYGIQVTYTGYHWNFTNQTNELYGLAWSTTALPAGDFNGDGTVDAADYVVWRKNDGTQNGYNTWRDNFGRTVGGGAMSYTSVPEPTTSLLFILWAATGCGRIQLALLNRSKTRPA